MIAHFSIWSQFYNTKEPEEAILEFEKDGLEYIELSSEHITSLLEREGDLKVIGSDFANFCLQHGVKIRQAHLIFPSPIATDMSTAELIDRQLTMLSAMGVKAAVLHGDPMVDSDISYEEKLDRNADALKVIAKSAEREGITICLENLRLIFASIDEILYVIEKVGSPAIPCATPTVKGLQTPDAKPQPTASILILTPVSGSHPIRMASATTIGTRGTHSSKEPTIAPSAIKNSISIAISRYFTAPKRWVSLPSIYLIRPHLSRLLKIPPITRRNAMTAISAPLPDAPSTRKGERSHFQNGMPPST